jgi:transmembrane sensor
VSAPRTEEFGYTAVQRRTAADWFVVIHDDEEPSAEVLQSWLRWMDENRGNRLAFEAIAQAWRGVSDAAALEMPVTDELQADTYDGDQSVDQWLAQTSPPEPRRAAGQAARTTYPTSRHVRRWGWLAAASLAAFTLAALLMNPWLRLQSQQPDTFVTKAGEQIQITLADGSTVWLGPKSVLQAEFTREQRSIRLATGEAFFSVRKDHSRPFVVQSRGGDITAVGTAFNVRAVTDRVTVSVSEGVVTVASLGRISPNGAPVRVASGQQLTFVERARARPVVITQSPAPGERSQWRDGVLVYRDEPLNEVIMDVARYSEKPVVLSGDSIGDMRYTGVVNEGAIQEWLTALPESFPVKIVDEKNRTVIAPR